MIVGDSAKAVSGSYVSRGQLELGVSGVAAASDNKKRNEADKQASVSQANKPSSVKSRIVNFSIL